MQSTPLHQIHLRNTNGMQASVINFGATVTSIKVPIANDDVQEVTLGFDIPEEYVSKRTHMGAIAGRVANRIAKGRFKLDGKTYQLNCNIGQNHLHGGPNGWAKVYWDVQGFTSDSVRLSYRSVDGDENYPGNVMATVTYALDTSDALIVEIEATTDAPTIVNPTNHCYFNLHRDHSKNILDHELRIHADHFTVTDHKSIPTGEIATVANTPMDFRAIKKIGEEIHAEYEPLLNAHGYDHNWVLTDYNGQIRKVATAHCPSSGITLETFTDQPGLQFYTGNHLSGVIGRNGLRYGNQAGFCLEAQGFPDAINHPNFPSVILQPGDRYSHHTRYQFSVK